MFPLRGLNPAEVIGNPGPLAGGRLGESCVFRRIEALKFCEGGTGQDEVAALIGEPTLLCEGQRELGGLPGVIVDDNCEVLEGGIPVPGAVMTDGNLDEGGVNIRLRLHGWALVIADHPGG